MTEYEKSIVRKIQEDALDDFIKGLLDFYDKNHMISIGDLCDIVDRIKKMG